MGILLHWKIIPQMMTFWFETLMQNDNFIMGNLLQVAWFICVCTCEYVKFCAIRNVLSATQHHLLHRCFCVKFHNQFTVIILESSWLQSYDPFSCNRIENIGSCNIEFESDDSYNNKWSKCLSKPRIHLIT